VVSQSVTVQDRSHEDPGPPLALKPGGRVEMLEIRLRDHGVDAPLADLVDDRIRIDDASLDETRPKEEIVHDRRDPALGE
jgi:hypothetical protein